LSKEKVLGSLPSGYQIVPSRLVHKDCIYSLPSGAWIKEESHGRLFVQIPGQSATEIPKFPHSVVKPQHGAAWKAWAQYENSQGVNFVSGKWNVPSSPQDTNDGQLLYYWNGVEPDDSSAVLQPVLQFGFSPAGGGNYWAMASWYVSSDHGAFYTTPYECNTSDVILGTLSMMQNGTWLVSGLDITNQQSTILHFTPQDPTYTTAYETLEAYNVNSDCQDYPVEGSITFYNIKVSVGGKPVIPKWTVLTKDNECNETAVALSSSSVKIQWNVSP